MSGTAERLEIPTINIAGYLQHDEQETIKIVEALRAACSNPGFFQVTGHQVSRSVRATLFTQLRQFFALPQGAKDALHRNNSPHLRGYETVGDEKMEHGFHDQKEGLMIGQELPPGRFLQGPNLWPLEEEAPGFRGAFMAYFEAVHELSKTMFRLMALTLDLDERCFDAFVDSRDSVRLCRAHRYPPTTTPEIAARSRGIGAHTDYGALTLLMQDDVGGLEVFHRESETWHAVPFVEDAYVVNIGDMMERWTNGKYMSTLHRVISPVGDKDRYSVVCFNEGLLDQVIECIPTCLGPGEKPKWKAVKVEDHLRARYGAAY